ncbi:MAG: uroporphyrinogen-III C-methyltransferase [Bryobacteraceae bacterium]
MSDSARIYLVGAGPGRADWLTLRAAQLLGRADVVIHDRLVSDAVLSLVNPAALLLSADEEEDDRERRQLRILHLLEFYAEKHRCVVRLKGGDPFVFGRGGEEWAWLVQRGWPVEVVPGVSSAISLPALAGIPPTFRGISSGFAVITGSLRGGQQPCWHRYAQVDTLIVLMGVRRRRQIAEALIEAGRPAAQPCCFIENGATPRERIVLSTLSQVALGQCAVQPPAVWVIGDVVALRAQTVQHAGPVEEIEVRVLAADPACPRPHTPKPAATRF